MSGSSGGFRPADIQAPTTIGAACNLSQMAPTDNAFAEAFNGCVRAECLNADWFLSLDDARAKCEAWRRDYNEHRPHSSLGN